MNSRPYNRTLLQSNEFDINEFIYLTRDIPYSKFSHCLNDHLNEVKKELGQLVNEEFQKFIQLYSNIGDSGLTEINELELKLNDVFVIMDEFAGEVLSDHQEANEIIDKMKQIEREQSALKRQKQLFQNIVEYEELCERKEVSFACLSYVKIKAEISALSEIIPSVSFISQHVHTLLEPVLIELEYQLIETLCKTDHSRAMQFAVNFITLGRFKDFEQHFIDQIIQPFCKRTINTKNLESLCKEQSEKPGLVRLFGIIIEFIRMVDESWIVPLQELLIDKDELPLNLIVQPILTRIISDLPIIFSPGVPEAFQHSYTASRTFLSELLEIYNTKVILESNIWKIFQKSWQINIYYQLRFRDAASRLEEALDSQLPVLSIGSSKIVMAKVQQFEALKFVIKDLWSDSCVITPLIGKFFKLTLQTFGRYIDWLVSIPSEFDGTELGLSTLLVKINQLKQLKDYIPAAMQEHIYHWMPKVDMMVERFMESKWKDAHDYLSERLVSSSLLFFTKYYQNQFNSIEPAKTSTEMIKSIQIFLDDFASIDRMIVSLIPKYVELVKENIEVSTRSNNNIKRLEHVMKGQLSEDDQMKRKSHDLLIKYVQGETALLIALCESSSIDVGSLKDLLSWDILKSKSA